MAMDIEYHQNRMPHTASVSVQWVSWPWASGSWCRLNRHHTRHGYRLHRCLSPPEDTTHGISIDCMGIGSISIGNCHLQRMPHTAWASVQWVSWPWASGSWCRLHEYRGHHTRHGYRLHGHQFHGHLVHGIGCMSIEDAGHGISIDCMGMGIMAMGIWFMVLAA